VSFATIIARNYLAHARVLARSVADHNPGERLVVLVIDDEGEDIDGSREPFDLIRPADLDLSRADFHRMATIYDCIELSTAIKPWLLEHLLRSRHEPAMYLDPDIEVFAPLDELAPLAVQHAIVLTPHTTTAVPPDGLGPSDAGLLKAGVYNLGFIGVGDAAFPFLQWWQERLARDCLALPDHGYAVDQKWIDFVPALFDDYYVLRDTAYNVAYWNLFGRTLTERQGAYYVDGRPLRFFHFSGYSPEREGELSKYQNRIRLADHPALAKLCTDYGRKLISEGYLECMSIPYAYDRTRSGLVLDQQLRRAYRDQLIAEERATGETSLPIPFEVEGSPAFLEWVDGLPAVDGAGSRGLGTIVRSSRAGTAGGLGTLGSMAGLRQTTKAALKKPAGPVLRALDRRIASVNEHVDEVARRTEELRQEVNVDLETVVELVLTFERFTAEFSDRMERITATLESLLNRSNTELTETAPSHGSE
jgi:hypothetical protein